MRTRPSNQVGAHEAPFDAVLFESGWAMRYPRGAEDDQPQMARITPAELQEFLRDIEALKLAQFSEQARLPPDSGYTELGIRTGEKLKRYAWSGNDWDLAASERDAFVRAWAEAESLIRRLDDRVWSPAPPDLVSEVAAGLRRRWRVVVRKSTNEAAEPATLVARRMSSWEASCPSESTIARLGLFRFT